MLLLAFGEVELAPLVLEVVRLVLGLVKDDEEEALFIKTRSLWFSTKSLPLPLRTLSCGGTGEEDVVGAGCGGDAVEWEDEESLEAVEGLGGSSAGRSARLPGSAGLGASICAGET